METSPTDPLRDFVLSLVALQEREAAEVKPWHSFWAHRPAKRFPPSNTELPEHYDGSDRLALSCTQTTLEPREQRKLVDRWCEALPHLKRVEFLWFHSKVLPEMFEAACRMPNLTGLYVKWSGIETLEPLRGLANLRYLRLGSSPGVRSLEPLSTLTQLRWLELENVKRIVDLKDISPLTNLVGFGFDGAEGSAHAIKTWQPLEHLTDLVWLKLGAVRSADGSLRPIADLKQLKWLGLARHYPMQEFAWLATRLPNTDCHWFQPFYTLPYECRRCKTAKMVMVTGKGKPTLCPECDGVKLKKHVHEFERAAAAAKTDR